LIDVIVPVYRGEQATRRALESVLASRGDCAFELVVVDDASPEPAISAWLRELAGRGAVTLIAHAENRGFVHSVNEAMALHPGRDVILLNSDTEVAPGWIDRLVACAAREAHAGTVTPFSNNATICSYPRFGQANELPEGMTAAQLDRLCASQNAGRSVDIPTAVGFCMLIARRCLDEVGLFDAESFGTGYGEEVDFCMRASRAGWRHVLCADTFVYHEGEVSFGSSGARRRETAQRLIDERYPEFQPALAQFLEREPARPLRRAIDVARLRSSLRPRLLFVTHHWGGGVEKHVGDLARLAQDAAEVLVLRPTGDGAVSLAWQRPGEEFESFFEVPSDWETMVAFLASLGIARLHLHHVHGYPAAILELPARLGIAYDVTLHDQFAVCPQYHLSDKNGNYCGEVDAAGCMRCLEARPAQWPMDIAAWRAAMRSFLGGAARVIAPSRDTAERTRRYYPEVKVLEWPHPQAPASARARPVKVLLLGNLAPIKGLEVVAACVQDAKARALPLHFSVLGHTAHSLPQWPDAPLTVSGTYPDERLAELVALERADVAFFPARIPESFSYTLTIAMNAGLPIAATDLGAFPERLRHYRPHVLLALDLSPALINDALLELAGERATWPRTAVAGSST
jgi:GT2 family glycosyltransferase/glycosyltransferase involved in cell wall biosynthesis